MDPLELRLRNCLREGDTTITGGHVSRPRAVEVLETLRRETNWGQVQLPAKPADSANSQQKSGSLARRLASVFSRP